MNPLVATQNSLCPLPSARWFSKDPPRNLPETYLKMFVLTYGYVPRSWLHDGENPTSIAIVFSSYSAHNHAHYILKRIVVSDIKFQPRFEFPIFDCLASSFVQTIVTINNQLIINY